MTSAADAFIDYWVGKAGREGCAVADEPALTRHAGHDPSLPCRPALGHGLCYPVPATEQLVPWREALKIPQQGAEPG